MSITKFIKHGGNMYNKLEYPKDEYASYQYPSLLCDYLCENYIGNRGLLLDLGCGKGSHMVGFKRQGFIPFGIDWELPEMTGNPFIDNTLKSIERGHIENVLPYDTSFFNVVFSKSVLEHLHSDEVLFEVHRILVPDGVALFMVPDWDAQRDVFYDDPTHIHPYTKKGLSMAFSMAGFSQVSCEYFYQLPFIWKYPFLKPFLKLLQMVPSSLKYTKGGRQRILIRHGKEKMILIKAVK